MVTWGNQNVPLELQEDLAQLFPGLCIEEALQHQESLYQSLKTSGFNQRAGSSFNEPSSLGHSWGESSQSHSLDYDLALDEALARSLQELDMDYDLEHVSYSETVQITPGGDGNTRHVAGGRPISAVEDDGINPDEMTYEELQSLGESIGTESKGLSEVEISRLPTLKYKTGFSLKYKTGFFSKKVDIGECAVCYSGYKNKDSVTTLPCPHQYHTKCINEWLNQSKTCPVCQKEVVLS